MIEMLIPKSAKGRRPQVKMTPQYITIHSTGNPRSTARNEASNVVNNNPEMKVSFHLVVDDKDVYQTLPFNEIGWHAGDGRGNGNYKSIGIEICESGDRRKALQNAIEVVKDLMVAYKIDINHVVQHNHWSGKDCPRILRNKSFIKDGLDWNWFIKQIGGDKMTVPEAKKIVKEKAGLSDDTMNYLSADYKYGDALIVKLAEAMN